MTDNIVTNNNGRVYSIGFANPIDTSFRNPDLLGINILGSCDYQIWFDGLVFRNIQSFRLKKINGENLGGELTFVHLYGQDLDLARGKLLGKIGLLEVDGSGEYGQLEKLYNYRVQFVDFDAYLSTNSYAIVYKYYFRVISEEPCEQPGEHP